MYVSLLYLLHTNQQSSETSYMMSYDTAHDVIQMLSQN